MPASKYHLIKDYGNSDDCISTSPGWLIAVVRFRDPLTFDRTKFTSFSGMSDLARFHEEPLLIQEDCLNVSISETKEGVHSTLSATLIQGEVNYLTDLLPGDWVMCWMVNDEDQLVDLRSRIRNGQACNRFSDGLKFVGRLEGLRKHIGVEPGSGVQRVRYRLQAIGFYELGTQIFYNPHLAQKQADLNECVGRLGMQLNDFIEGGEDEATQGVSINKAVPFLLEVLLGSGITQKLAKPDIVWLKDEEKNLELTEEQKRGLVIMPNFTGGDGESKYAYLIPNKVGKLLGRSEPTREGGLMSYSDIVDLVYGVQRYVSTSSLASNDENHTFRQPFNVFTPDGIHGQLNNHKFTNKPLLGFFAPTIPDFSDKTVWNILRNYLNGTVNEMFTCMRVNNLGKVVPTIVLRQIPLTTHIMANTMENRKNTVTMEADADGNVTTTEGTYDTVEVTPFLELPRWVVDPAMMRSMDVGRSNIARFNFIHVYGQSAKAMREANITHQIIRNPPILDSEDVKAHGLRSHMSMVACDIQDLAKAPRVWMEIASDFLIGQHLTLSGTIDSIGIQSPICIGDNLEFDGVVYHIESVSHQGGIGEGGIKQFSTSISLANGMRADLPDDTSNNPKWLYPGMDSRDQIFYHPGLTYEGVSTEEGKLKIGEIEGTIDHGERED